MKRKFYKTTIRVEILSEDAPVADGTSLTDIDYMITEGGCSGSVSVEKHEELTPLEAAQALVAQGSDPSFFQLHDPPEGLAADTKVYPSKARNKRAKPGRLTGSFRPCAMDGCAGVRVGVRWPDGRITYPCTKGMGRREDGDWEIN